MSIFSDAAKKVSRAGGSKVVIGKVPQSPPSGVYPEPGEWVYDRPKGMKPISRPEPLPAGPISIDEVQHHIRYEGLGACILGLIPSERIADQLLAALWWKARSAMRDVLKHLEDHE